MRRARVASALIGALVLGACAGTAPERFYVLEPVALPALAAGQAWSVALDPVSIPALLDRSEMVFQGAQGEVFVSEDRRWAEPLNDGVGRVVAQDLSARLGGAAVGAYPQAPLQEPMVRVKLVIATWQIRPGQQFDASVDWSVRKVAHEPGDASAVRRGRLVIATPLEGRSIDVALAAQNHALAELSAALAQAVQSLMGTT